MTSELCTNAILQAPPDPGGQVTGSVRRRGPVVTSDQGELIAVLLQAPASARAWRRATIVDVMSPTARTVV